MTDIYIWVGAFVCWTVTGWTLTRLALLILLRWFVDLESVALILKAYRNKTPGGL